MKRIMRKGMMTVLVAAVATSSVLAGCGSSKKAVTDADFKATFEGLNKQGFGGKQDADKKKAFVIAQLGAPHHEEGTTLAWYSAPEKCHYYKFDAADGLSATGTESKAECEKYAVK